MQAVSQLSLAQLLQDVCIAKHRQRKQAGDAMDDATLASSWLLLVIGKDDGHHPLHHTHTPCLAQLWWMRGSSRCRQRLFLPLLLHALQWQRKHGGELKKKWKGLVSSSGYTSQRGSLSPIYKGRWNVKGLVDCLHCTWTIFITTVGMIATNLSRTKKTIVFSPLILVIFWVFFPS